MNQDTTPVPPDVGKEQISAEAWRALILNTAAFTVCFAVWMMNGVLMTFLVDSGVYDWDPASLGWLIGIPVLTGSIMRLPIGVLTDKYGGKWVFGLLLLGSAIPTYLVSVCDTFGEFFLASLGFGMIGTGFAVGIAFTSVWFPPHRQGLALGIFGAGNAGAALTSLLAPSLLRWLTNSGENLDAWRTLPKIYAAALLLMGVAFLLFTKNRLPPGAAHRTLGQQLQPLANIRVWRFGLYYFYVFGGFVALAQWLIPYYVNAYAMSVVTAGLLASIFSLPSGLVRAVGGWLSDKFGARTVMYWVFGLSLVCFLPLLLPQMDIQAPGSGIMSRSAGKVLEVSDSQVVLQSRIGKKEVYAYQTKTGELVTDSQRRSGLLILPRGMSWQEPVVEVGAEVQKRQLLARGVTHIFFQANVWIFTALVFVVGVATGIGKAAVYRYIPDYFPGDVGVVGGIVGVLGGLGGFICPIIFGYLLKWTGIWTTCWLFFLILTAICTIWLHVVVRSILKKQSPEQLHRIEHHPVELVPRSRESEVMIRFLLQVSDRRADGARRSWEDSLVSTTASSVSANELEQWAPENEAFWEQQGRSVAWRTLTISTFNLLLAFATWFMVSTIVVRLEGIGFPYDTTQLFWLTAMPGLAGGTLRIVHMFLIPIFGTRATVTWATLSLILPCVGWGLAVQDPNTPFWVMLLLAFLAGLGGGNFSSFMPSTSLFFPKRLQGTALGIQAGIGNLGVSIAQFVVPWIIAIAMLGSLVGSSQTLTRAGQTSSIYLQNAAYIWIPFILAGSAAAWFLLRSVPVHASFLQQTDIFKEKHTWIMTSLYIMTFGSFSGFAAIFPLLIKKLFGGFENAPDALTYAFLGPLVGSVARVAFGPISDRFGGARVTQISGVGMLACTLSVTFFASPTSMSSFPGFLACMLGLFFFSGVGNASTFKQIPAIFPARQAGGVIGWTAAVAAYGPFLFSVLIAWVFDATGKPTCFFYSLAVFYVINIALNWWYYARAGAEKPC